MEVIQQPLAGRADVVVTLRGQGKAVVRVGYDAASQVEPLEEPVARARWARGEPLTLRQRPRALGKMLGAQQLAPDRTGEELVEGGTEIATVEAASDGGRERDAEDGDSRRSEGESGRSELKVTRGGGGASRASGFPRARTSV